MLGNHQIVSNKVIINQSRTSLTHVSQNLVKLVKFVYRGLVLGSSQFSLTLLPNSHKKWHSKEVKRGLKNKFISFRTSRIRTFRIPSHEKIFQQSFFCCFAPCCCLHRRRYSTVELFTRLIRILKSEWKRCNLFSATHCKILC